MMGGRYTTELDASGRPVKPPRRRGAGEPEPRAYPPDALLFFDFFIGAEELGAHVAADAWLADIRGMGYDVAWDGAQWVLSRGGVAVARKTRPVYDK